MLLRCWGKRECILILFQPIWNCEKLSFFEDCKLSTSLGLFQGVCASFSCLYATSFLLSFKIWGVFHFFHFFSHSLNCFFTLIAFDKKGHAMPKQSGVRFVWPCDWTNYIITKQVLTRRFSFWSFVIARVLIPFRAWPLWSGCEVLLSHDWDNNDLFCSWTRLWISSALGC